MLLSVYFIYSNNNELAKQFACLTGSLMIATFVELGLSQSLLRANFIKLSGNVILVNRSILLLLTFGILILIPLSVLLFYLSEINFNIDLKISHYVLTIFIIFYLISRLIIGCYLCLNLQNTFTLICILFGFIYIFGIIILVYFESLHIYLIEYYIYCNLIENISLIAFFFFCSLKSKRLIFTSEGDIKKFLFHYKSGILLSISGLASKYFTLNLVLITVVYELTSVALFIHKAYFICLQLINSLFYSNLAYAKTLKHNDMALYLSKKYKITFQTIFFMLLIITITSSSLFYIFYDNLEMTLLSLILFVFYIYERNLALYTQKSLFIFDATNFKQIFLFLASILFAFILLKFNYKNLIVLNIIFITSYITFKFYERKLSNINYIV